MVTLNFANTDIFVSVPKVVRVVELPKAVGMADQ